MIDLVIFIILSCVVHRITRFIVLDNLWDETRDKLFDWLTTGPDASGERRPLEPSGPDKEFFRKLPFFRRKTAELLGCPYCVSVWVAGFVLLGYWAWTRDHGPVPAPFYWLGLASGGLVVMEIVDHD